MKGLKLQLKKAQSFGQPEKELNEQNDGSKSNSGGDILIAQEDQNNSSDQSSSMIKSRNRSSTLEIIEEVETRKEQYLKKSIQNLTEREEDNDSDDNEEDEFSEDASKKNSSSSPEKRLVLKDGSEGESQDSGNESPAPKSSRGQSPLKKSPVFKKRMSIIDECLDQIRKRRDLIAAKLISNTYELDEDLLDSSDLSDIDQKNNNEQSKFNLSQKFNSGNTNNQQSSINTNEELNISKKDEVINTSRQIIEDSLYLTNQQNNLNTSKLSENAPIISVEKLDSIINPIQVKSPSQSSSPRKNQPSIKQSQVSPSNNIKQSTIKQSQYVGNLGMSRNFGGSKRFDLRKSTLYQNVGGLTQSRMINATTNNLKKSSNFCFEGFQDRQFARQLMKMQEDEDKSLVRQFENFIDQIRKEKEMYVKKIKDKRDNIKDFFKDRTLSLNKNQQNLNTTATKDANKKGNNSQSMSRILQKVKGVDGEENNEFSQSINLIDAKNENQNNQNDENQQYKINFQEYEDLNVYELLEKIEEEFLSKKQMDPQVSQFLRESMMMSIAGGTGFGFGENMDKTFFPLVVTEQDYQNFEMRKQLDEMTERIKHKNLIKLEQMLDKQKHDLKELEVEYCKLQINYKIFQQNEQLKEEMQREKIKNKKKQKQIARLAQSQIIKNGDGSDSNLQSEDSDDDDQNSLNDQSILKSQSFLNCTLAMNNNNFEERQKSVIETFNELCSEYGQLKENMQKSTSNFVQKLNELEEKRSFLENINNNMEQALEYNQKIYQFQQKNKSMIPESNDLRDNDNEMVYLIKEVQLLEKTIERKRNESNIEFQFKKNRKINQLLQFKNRLSKLSFQREFQSLLLDIGNNSDILMQDKQLLQELLQDLKDKFEQLKEYNIAYKDQVIEKQMEEIDQIKVEIENNQHIQRDLTQKLDFSTRLLWEIGSKAKSNQPLHLSSQINDHHSPQKNNLYQLQLMMQQEKYQLLNEIEQTKKQNEQVEYEINNLQFEQMNNTLINQNMYIEQLKQTYHIQI